MLKCTLAAASVALILAGASAAGQPNPGNTPPAAWGRALDMGEQDTLVSPSAADQIARGAQSAATERAATAGRRGHSTRARPATPAEIIAGSALADSGGAPIGIIEAVTADGAIVSNGTVRVMVPLGAFGIDGTNLMLGITKAEFDAAAAGAQP